MVVTLYADGRKKIVNKKEKHGGGRDSREFSETEKKTMEGVVERKQQRKVFGGKKQNKLRCIYC